MSFSFEQSVQGNGYYMAYKYAKMGNAEFKDYAHGSGSFDNEAILASYDATRKYHLWNADWNDYNVSCIQYKETTHAVYAPTRIAIGTGYYAANPLNYDSLIKEETWLKNSRAGTSMENQVEYAHKLDKDLSLTVKDYTNFTYDPTLTSNAFSQMKIKEDVGEGKIHIGVLQASYQYGSTLFDAANHLNSAWKRKPAIEIDEDYFGTYHVEKNMTLSVPYSRNRQCMTGCHAHVTAAGMTWSFTTQGTIARRDSSTARPACHQLHAALMYPYKRGRTAIEIDEDLLVTKGPY